ncbi:hypothetical protein ACFZCP_22660 [Streptomyces sp. NPDC007971]|uniref:hypothetical protein n=1 Tax=Streptomyces sp. NPDC007971 TaxID=3364799 RepID=UPI0036E1D954
MPGTVLLLAASPLGRGRLVDAAGVLPVLAAVAPPVLSGTDTANVVELADPLEPQAVLTRLRAAAAAPGPLTVYIAGQLQLDRRQHLPHLALARTTPATVRYTALPWHWIREELRLRSAADTALVVDLHADAEAWRHLAERPLDSGRTVSVYGRVAPPASGRRGMAEPAYMKAVATLLRSGHRPPLAQLHEQALVRIAEVSAGRDLVLAGVGGVVPGAGVPGAVVSGVGVPGSVVSGGFAPSPPYRPERPRPQTPDGLDPVAVRPQVPQMLQLPDEAGVLYGGPQVPGGPDALAGSPQVPGGSGVLASGPQVPGGAHVLVGGSQVSGESGLLAGGPEVPAAASVLTYGQQGPDGSGVLAGGPRVPGGPVGLASVQVPPGPSGLTVDPQRHGASGPSAGLRQAPGGPDVCGAGVRADGGAGVQAGHPPASGGVLSGGGDDPHAAISVAVQGGRHAEADGLAARFEQDAVRAHGAASDEALHWSEVRADLAMFAGDAVGSCRAWLGVAGVRLAAGQAVDAPAVEAAADRAHHQWGCIKDSARARELGPAIAELRFKVPGRRQGALENVQRHLRQLQLQ